MEKEFESAGLVRRLAAILYDSLLIIAIWLITTLLLVALINEGNPCKDLYSSSDYILKHAFSILTFGGCVDRLLGCKFGKSN